ncbi:MAG: hypothetical protein C4541_12120 [Candidatus Auribacter fodinae]|uniref:Uncharacterized protein n=1 Tax=Candidatus Auribacter fodinae TaxID=2093366 RepID=A0A3A4QRD8_9BACT|nr:MAG: hypothetical protein C4541_12120 [Candidatus Auribacter fodinae]
MKTNSDSSLIARNTIWRLLQLTALGLGSIVINAFLTRRLPTPDYALWVLAFSILGIFYLFADFGLNQTMAKYTAEYSITAKDKLSALVTTGLVNLGANALIACLSILILSPVIEHFMNQPGLTRLLIIGSIFIISRVGMEMVGGILRGLHDFAIPSKISAVVTCVEIVVYYIWFSLSDISLTAIFVVRSLFFLIQFILIYSLFYFQYARKYFSIRINLFDKEIFISIIKYCLPIGFSFLSYYLYTKVDILILGIFSPDEEIARYNVADLLFQLPLMGLAAYISVISPKVTNVFYAKQHERMQHIFSLSITLVTIPMTLFTVLFFAVPEFILNIIFPQYVSASVLLRILAPLLILKGIGQVAAGGFLVSTGHPRILAIITAVGAVMNVIFDLLLIPPFGAEGAFVTTTVIHSLAILFSLYYISKTLHLKIRFKKLNSSMLKSIFTVKQ